MKYSLTDKITMHNSSSKHRAALRDSTDVLAANVTL